MTQLEIIKELAEKTGLPRAMVKQLFDEIAALAAVQVRESGEFTLPGFGKLITSKRMAREGRNPATGQAIKIAAKTTLKFRIGKSMKFDALGEDYEAAAEYLESDADGISGDDDTDDTL
ncbi:MAG TPA: HU family DNA-binding protein [Pyrinomonadaceae bacterium]|jgi:DNA-binding protein HU-beta|nr:HU family DNA-binding protein [Pyrinomonadaceae bacterium]